MKLCNLCLFIIHGMVDHASLTMNQCNLSHFILCGMVYGINLIWNFSTQSQMFFCITKHFYGSLQHLYINRCAKLQQHVAFLFFIVHGPPCLSPHLSGAPSGLPQPSCFTSQQFVLSSFLSFNYCYCRQFHQLLYIIKPEFIHCIFIVGYNNTSILNAIKPSSLTLLVHQ